MATDDGATAYFARWRADTDPPIHIRAFYFRRAIGKMRWRMAWTRETASSPLTGDPLTSDLPLLSTSGMPWFPAMLLQRLNGVGLLVGMQTKLTPGRQVCQPLRELLENNVMTVAVSNR